MPRRWWFLVLLLAGGSLTCAASHAQEPTTPAVTPAPAENTADGEASGAREVRPMIFYVWDEKAKRHKAILSTSLEELQELEALREKPADETGPQRFRFAEGGANITGAADNKRAELTIQVGLETNDEDWLAVPLRLNGAVLQSANFQGPGTHFIQYDDANGHVAWIRSGAKEAKYQLELKLLASVSQVGDENRLDLKLPRVAPSKMALTVATPNAQGVVNTGAQIIKTEPQGEATRFELQASSSDLRLAWQGTRQPSTIERPAAFDAVGEILVRIESASHVVWDATFDISVQQGEISAVGIRLPPGTTLVTDDPAIRPSMMDDGGKQPMGQVVDVEFERPLQKGATREIRLQCERLVPPRNGQPLTGLEVGGFDVQGAAQQRGHIGVVLGDAWRCDAKPGNNTLRDDALPDGFREAGVLGSDVYRYVSRANSLVIDISPRRKKLTLIPTYILEVQADRVNLDARLRYQVLGARTDSCRVDLPGWEAEAVELVQVGAMGETREPIDFDPFATEPLAINLPRTMRGEFEIRIRARHDLAVDAIDFALPLPRPAADEREPAIVVVQAANNIDLRYLLANSRGLLALDAPAPVQLARRQQPPLVFQELPDELDPTFAAELDVRSREISVASLLQAEITQNSLSAHQRLDYVVRYQPLRSVILEAPRWLQQHEKLDVSLNDSLLPRSRINFVEGDEPDAGAVFMHIDLGEPIIGAFTLEISHSLGISPLEPGAASPLELTVLAPRDEAVAVRHNRVEVRSDPHVLVTANDANWEVRPGEAATARPLVLDGQPHATQVELLTTFNESRSRRTTVVEKLWLQSWLAGDQRQERAVYQVRTNDTRLVVQCPESLPLDDLVLVVDGGDVVPHVDAKRQLLVDLPGEQPTADESEAMRRHTLELWWPQTNVARSNLDVEPPQIEGAWIRQVYWHVVLPRTRVALTTPAGMAAEMVWRGPWWQSPRLEQAQLESWCGATKQDAPATSQFNAGYRQYLYSSIGAPPQMQVATQNGALWMLLISGLALGAICALVYAPVLRHPLLLLTAGAALLVFAMWWPTLGMLAAQCVILVIVLVGSVLLIDNLLARRRGAARPFGMVNSTSPTARRRRSVEIANEPMLSRPSTTATAAMSLPLAPEAKT